MMDYREAISRAIDIQAYIRVLKANFKELVSIEADYIQIRWDAFSALFKEDSYVDVHFFEGGYEHKRGWYNGVYIVTCREVKPNET